MATVEQLRNNMIDMKLETGDPAFRWSILATPNGYSPSQIAKQEYGLRPAALESTDLPLIGPRIFAQGDSLSQTIKALSGSRASNTESVRGTALQVTNNTFTLFYEAKPVQGNPSCFLTILSRGPAGTQIADRVEQDYAELSMLSEEFNRRLKPRAKQRFGVATPLAFNYVGYNGQHFPFFTMPFTPGGELALDGARDTEGGYYPFFRYKTEYSLEMSKTISEQIVDAYSVVHAKEIGESKPVVNNLTARLKFPSQVEETLTMKMLIYLLSGRRFPNEYQISNGGLIADVGSKRPKVTLTTVAGGLSLPMTEEEFSQRILSHQEPLISYPQVRIHPYFQFDKERFTKFLSEAKSLIS